jgi:ABC-type antimicrobial peptide transport system permease subunit
MRFSRFVLDWAAAHPVLATFTGILAVLLAFALLPLAISLLPVRKVPIRYNLRNLQARWKTTLVTGIAFTLVTALLTDMLAFVTGMARLTESSGHPGNVLILSDGATDEAFSKLPPFSIEELPSELQGAIEKDGKDFLATQEVYVIVTYAVPDPKPGSPKRRFIQMRGLDRPEVAGKVHGVELAAGRWPSASGAQALKINRNGSEVDEVGIEIVLGDGAAKAFGADFGKPALGPGDVVEIGAGRSWVVVGVLSPANNTFGSEIWARDRPVQDNFGRNNPFTYTSYVVRTKNARTAELAAAALKNARGLGNLQATPERVYYSKLSDTNRQFSVAIYVVAVVMAVGGMLGIMNTMFAAISQRIKDVGVLRLMGYRRWQIFTSFQTESVVIGLVGGALGVLVGYLWADGRTATSIVSSAGGGGGKSIVLTQVVDAVVITTGMIFALLMGALGGILPSWRAMRTLPLDSLK